MDVVSEQETAVLRDVVERLAKTWNAGDGRAFAGLFTEDAVFVDIKANRDNGREAIGARHVRLFETVFKDTQVTYDLVDAATIAPGLVLGHIRAHVGMAGETLETLATCVFRLQDGGWRLLMFHNTEIGRYGC